MEVKAQCHMILNTKTGIVCQPVQKKWSLKDRAWLLIITHIMHFNTYYSYTHSLLKLESTSIITGPSQGKWINMPETAGIARLHLDSWQMRYRMRYRIIAISQRYLMRYLFYRICQESRCDSDFIHHASDSKLYTTLLYTHLLYNMLYNMLYRHVI